MALSSAKSNARHFLLRRLHSLTGIVFGLYIIIHLIVNASLIQGRNPDVFQEQVNKIHSLPFLLAIEWVMIFIPIIFHSVYGIWITLAGRPNIGNYPYAKNIFYFAQRASAVIIVLFLLFHVLGMKGFLGSYLEFEPGLASASTARHINAHWLIAFLVYPLGIAAATFHLANGFWAAAITWGLTISKASQRRWGLVCAGIFALTFGCGLTAWIAAVSLKGAEPIKPTPAAVHLVNPR